MSNVDVMSTLLDLVDVEIPQTVQGDSFVPVLTGQKDKIKDDVFSCGWSKETPAYRHLSLHSDKYRITYWPGQKDGELYDFDRDPNEYENLFHCQEYSALRDKLLEKLFRTYVQAGPLEPHVWCNW